MLPSGTLRSQGQTLQRISSVSSPPSLMAIRRKAATSTGVTLNACEISASFLFLFDSASNQTITIVILKALHYGHYLLCKTQRRRSWLVFSFIVQWCSKSNIFCCLQLSRLLKTSYNSLSEMWLILNPYPLIAGAIPSHWTIPLPTREIRQK